MRAFFSLCGVGLMAVGCSSGEPSTATGLAGSGGSAGTTVIGTGGTGTAATGGSAGTTIIGTSGSGTTGGSGGSGGIDACETVSTGATLQPVYLVFAFDVSGS